MSYCGFYLHDCTKIEFVRSGITKTTNKNYVVLKVRQEEGTTDITMFGLPQEEIDKLQDGLVERETAPF